MNLNTSINKVTAFLNKITKLLIPLVAFDKNLNRLGYGGGYYDRIIKFLKKKKKIITIGLAFDFQKFNSLPISKFDQKLDYIVTNKNILQ